jgi:Fe-S-cluster containining protein
MVSAPEAFRLAAEVARAAVGATSGLEDFIARAASTANLTATDRFARKLPCPLLHDGACSVYRARPLACRRVTSFQVDPCIEEYEGRDGEILLPTKLLTHATNTQIPLLAAIRAFGRSPKIYELSAAVKTVLDTAGAETRWLAGEDVFRAVVSQEETAQELVAAIERLAFEVRAVGVN